MLFWLGLVAGAIIGWLVEWVIDWRYWRADIAVASDEEGRLRRELDVARLEIANLQAQVQRRTDNVAAGHAGETVGAGTEPQDRLQDINGIGQVYAKKLNDADIHTFAQLSETSIDRLTEIINPQEWQTVDFDAWIRQARAFTKNADRGK